MSIRDCIIMESENLDTGTSTRIQCPFCLDNEDTLSLTLEEGFVLYHCFRASCGQKGRINIPGIFKALKEEKEEDFYKTRAVNEQVMKVANWYNDGAYSLPELGTPIPPISPNIMYLADTVYHFGKDIFITELDRNNAYMCKRVGMLGEKTLGGKARNYMTEGYNNKGLELYSNPLSSIFICEDIISGMWIRQVTKRNTFILFGTSLTHHMYNNCLKEYDNWIWCLDNDTNYGPSQKYKTIRNEYPTHEHTFMVLTKDPKDHLKSELLNALNLSGGKE